MTHVTWKIHALDGQWHIMRVAGVIACSKGYLPKANVTFHHVNQVGSKLSTCGLSPFLCLLCFWFFCAVLSSCHLLFSLFFKLVNWVELNIYVGGSNFFWVCGAFFREDENDFSVEEWLFIVFCLHQGVFILRSLKFSIYRKMEPLRK